MTIRELLNVYPANMTAVEIYDIDDNEIMKTTPYSLLLSEVDEEIANEEVRAWDIFVDINGEPEICIFTDYR